MSVFEIGATLGIPGFSLAAFIWLMNRLDLPKPPVKWRGPIYIAYLVVIGGVVVFAIDRFGPQPADMEIAVTVKGPSGELIGDAEIRTVPQGVARVGDGSYVVTFSRDGLPDLIEFYASARINGGEFVASKSVDIAELAGDAVELQLRPLEALVVSGYVRDKATGRAIAAAKVAASGKSTRTNEDGWFEIEFDDGVTGDVRLHVDAEGYKVLESYAAVGANSVVVLMEGV